MHTYYGIEHATSKKRITDKNNFRFLTKPNLILMYMLLQYNYLNLLIKLKQCIIIRQ